MLLPALTKARDQARKIQCIANLKQLGIMLYVYIDSYNEYWPQNNTTAHYTHPNVPDASIRTSLQWNDYVIPLTDKRGGVISCDTNAPMLAARGGKTHFREDPNAVINCYIGNGHLLFAPQTTYDFRFTKNSMVKDPSGTVALTEVNPIHWSNTLPAYAAECLLDIDPTTYWSRVGYVHDLSANALWADGHVNNKKGPFAPAEFSLAND